MLLVLLVVAAAATAFVDSTSAEAIGVVGMVLGHGVGGFLMLRRSRRLPSAERRPWQVMGVGLLIAASGLGVVAALGGEAPVFGPADIFFLMAYVMMLIALALLVRMDPGGQPLGLTLLDVTVGAVAAAAIVWDVVLEELVHIEVTPFERIGLSLYPILDVGVIVGLCVVALRRTHYRLDVRLLLIAPGMALQVGGDLTYLRAGVQAVNFADAEPRFWLFLLASAAFLASSLTVHKSPEKKEFPDRDAPLWALMWPYLLAVALVPVHVARVEAVLGGGEVEDSTGERVILYALLLVGVLVVVRQVSAIRFNRMRIERQRRELISSVSHELRTPLTAVVGFLQVLDEDPDSFTLEEQESMMREVSSQAKHMSRTVTDLITLARDGGEKLMVRSAETSLASIIESASIEVHGVAFTSDVDDHTLHVDADRVEQAVGHLLSNARKYGGDRVHLRTDVQGGTLTIEIHDDGPGVPTKYLTSVWNQFDRGARRLDSTNPGLGIGLAIVRAVAVAHGGTAEYRQSELLGGSCFSISIPANVRTGAPWIRELTAR
ncbi:MAG TPA: HAMP domain-containing sensor histidine kinase [Acidimicrobiia bacterium]|nr:HAMP domain-containing sensor histidine kinase [Acidimicrobiia bacterium]